MIERFYLKECLSFDEAECELKNGLIVFTGPSGSGKSVLMQSILASLGFADALASLSESDVNWTFDEEAYGVVNDEPNTLRQIKKEKVRYFINGQGVSKRLLGEITRNHVRHLSLKDYSDFENENLLMQIDTIAAFTEKAHALRLVEYTETFRRFKEARSALASIVAQERQIVELREFAAFEISKIDEIAPVVGEDAELMTIKRLLSKKEKVQELIRSAEAVFESEHAVNSALGALEIDSAFFDDAMNELRSRFESAQLQFDELEEIDIEAVLDRIEKLSELKRRYGGIEEALAYREEKAAELQRYENIDFEKSRLEEACALLDAEVREGAEAISSSRRVAVKRFTEELNGYLRQLYLDGVSVDLEEDAPSISGKDRVVLTLQGATLQRISAGEFNRLRLALLAVRSEYMEGNGGVLMLDEIDANLSGEESMSVAKVLRHLARRFQIFAISHQPQLTSMGDQHYLVYKEGGVSLVRELADHERIVEIARIISADNITQEAIDYATKLMQMSRS